MEHDPVVSTVSRAILTPDRLLERDDALSALDEALEEALRGAGRVALVSGEAGIGKTALVRAFEETAKSRARVVTGACEALFTPRPLGAVRDIADELGGGVLAALTSRSERAEILSAFLAELRSTPTLAVIEDVHWADEATLDAISYLGRRLDTTSSLVVLTFRDYELDARHPLRIVIGDLPSRSTIRIRLEPLTPRATSELARLAKRSAQGLYEATGGNPFFVTEVLAAGGSSIPETVRDAVLARAARLSDRGRRLLDAAAVVPGSADLWLLERLAEGGLPYLDECFASGVLRATPRGVEFRHELARRTIEEALAPHRRIELHELAFRAIAASKKSDLAALAHHADAAGDSEAVVRFAPAAAERASELGAHREAAAQYARALRFADALPLAAQADFCDALSYESYLTGEFGDAIEASTQALERYRRFGDALSEGECLHTLSLLEWSSGRTPEASDLGREAVRLLEALPAGRELARAYAQLAALSLSLDDSDGVVAWGTRAATLAESLGEREILGLTRLTVGAAEYAAGVPGGLETLERELELALSEGLEEVAARAFNYIVRIAMRLRDYAVVDRYLDAGFDYCRDRELGNFRQGLGAERARRFFDRGDWAAATDATDLVLSTARTAGMAPFIALTVLGHVRARRGDPEVWAPLDRALAMAEPSGELQRLGLVAGARAEAAWLADDPRRASAEARVGFDLAVKKRHPWLAGELAYWQWKCGALGSAPEWIAQPYALQIAGEWQRAAEAWRTRDCPYEAALALAEGDTAAQREAYDEFLRLGAAPAAKRVARSLRERGAPVPRGPRPSTQENPAQLTAREIEVLALLAEGLRNAEIAERLFLSRKTVDHHVSAILRKVGAKSRLEAVTVGSRLGLLQHR
jgi:DNA-binding CsgD family transcriptional regulator/type II secretory pathway predicted ATPase ExeA